LIGVGLGVLISPLMWILKKRYGIARSLSALIIFFLMLVGSAGLGYGIFFLVADQGSSLVARAPQIIAAVQKRAADLSEKQPWLVEQIQAFDFAAAAKAALQKVFQGLGAGTMVVSTAILIFLIALYVAINSSEYFGGLVRAFPAHRRAKATTVLRACGQVLRRWFRSQLIVMSITGTVTTLGLWIIGVDYWLLFGLMTALLGVIPYVGIILTVVATSLVTLGTNPENIYWVLGLFFVVQQLEGNFLIPYVMKENIELPEAHLIILMLILSSWFGILGAFMAPPLLAVGRKIYHLTYLPEMDAATEVAVGRGSSKA
jgi:predicted PurR-regulated permease PerM